MNVFKTMKTKILLIISLISAGLLLGTTAYARNGGGNGGGNGNRGNGGAGGDTVRHSYGQPGNPTSPGTPKKDGSGKASAPGKGAKDGSGNKANCPVPPKN